MENPSFFAISHLSELRRIIRRHKRYDVVFACIGLLTLTISLFVLTVLFINLFIDGHSQLTTSFLSHFPSRHAHKAGLLSAWVGSLLVMVVTFVTAVPIGVATGVYLEEYAAKNWLADVIEINISNLAGVPSIVYGLLALGLFVYGLDLGRSILTAGLTLGLLILPIVISTTREAIRTVPIAIKEAVYALGSTKWQMILHHLLHYAFGGIMTGIIIGMSRALGETAPIITVGALTYVAFLPSSPFMNHAPFVNADWLFSGFTVLPIQMFNWLSRPSHDFHVNAAAAGVIIIAVTLPMNSLAIWLRYRVRQTIKW